MSEKEKSGAGKGLAVFGVIILLLGAALFIYGMSVIDWDFKQLSTFRYEYRTYEAENDEIDSIFVDFDQTNVRVEISETAQKITISYPLTFDRADKQKTDVTVSAEGGKLTLREESRYNWADHAFNLNWVSPQTVITLPSSAFVDINVKTSYGDVVLAGGSYGMLSLETSCGDVKASGFVADAATLKTDAGDVKINDADITKKLVAKTHMGDVEAYGVQAYEIDLHSDLGEIEVENLDAQSIRLTSSYGDVSGSIEGAAEDFKIDAKTDLGDNNLSNRTDGAKSLYVHTALGDIEISFNR